MPIPVYAFTGFLEAGKTKFIQETLEDERFNSGERTLLLVCEEGEEEYDLTTYPHKTVYLETIDDQDAVTTEELERLRMTVGLRRPVGRDCRDAVLGEEALCALGGVDCDSVVVELMRGVKHVSLLARGAR